MVPVLTGVNYRDWATRLAAYLKVENLWGYASGEIPKPAIPLPPASAADVAAAVTALNIWAGYDERVMGTIVLTTAPSVRVHLKKENSGSGYWNALRKVYNPRPAITRKPLDKAAIVQAPTMEEALLAAKVIAAVRKNQSPTAKGQRHLAAQILQALSSKPSTSDAKQRGQPDASSKRGHGSEQRRRQNKRAPKTSIADQSANTQKGKGAPRAHRQNAGPSKLTVSPPSHGISDESKPTVLSMANIGHNKGREDFFPKIAESSNLNDKLGVPVNTLRPSAPIIVEHREEASASYKDALLTVAAAPINPSADDPLLMLLSRVQLKESPQESLTGNSELVDHELTSNDKVHSKRKQRSQRMKLIQSVSMKYDRPKTRPPTSTPLGTVIPSDKKERKLLRESSDGVETLHLNKPSAK